MEAIGAALARSASAEACIIYLTGQLAAGKTTLARGFVRSCGHEGAVKSPTFTLVESYSLSACVIHHFDLYRINAPEELEYVGIEDYFESGAMVLVEWSERGLGVIGAADLEIHLTVDGTSRAVDLEARSERGKSVLQVFNSIYGSCS